MYADNVSHHTRASYSITVITKAITAWGRQNQWEEAVNALDRIREDGLKLPFVNKNSICLR